MFSQPQVQGVLGRLDDQTLMGMLNKPGGVVPPTTSADIQQQLAKNAQTRNIGQMANPTAPATTPASPPGLPGLPANNLVGMAAGGIVPQAQPPSGALPQDPAAMKQMLMAELQRRQGNTGAGIAGMAKGGKTDSGAEDDPFGFYRTAPGAENESPLMNALRAKLAQWNSPIAESSNYSAMPAESPATVASAAPTPVSAAAPAPVGAPPAPQQTAAAPAPAGTPGFNPWDSATPIGTDSMANFGGKQPSPAQLAAIQRDMAMRGVAANGAEPEVSGIAGIRNKAQPVRSMTEYVNEILKLRDTSDNDEAKKVIANMRKRNESNDSFTQGILSAAAAIASSGGLGQSLAGGLGKGLAAGVGSYQAANQQQQAADLAINKEDLARMRLNSAERNAALATGVSEHGQDVRSQAAAETAANMAAATLARERASNYAADQRLAAAQAHAQGNPEMMQFRRQQAAQKAGEDYIKDNQMLKLTDPVAYAKGLAAAQQAAAQQVFGITLPGADAAPAAPQGLDPKKFKLLPATK